MTTQAAVEAVRSEATAYDRAQFDDNFPAGIENHYWFRARNAVLDRTIADAVRQGWLPPDPALMEVGCGTGIVVAALRARGHRVTGVELGRPPRLLAPGHVTTGMEAAALPQRLRTGMDGVMLLDVIEHVADDSGLLRTCLAAFPRSGAILVTVPARPELWSAHDRHYGHHRRYTPASLTDCLRAAGLRPRRVRYMFRSLFVAAALLKAVGRDRDPVLTAPRGRVLHGALAGVLALEDRMLSTAPLPGLSLIAVATRS